MTKTPKLRFPGFTDDWEQRKLGEVAEIVGGGTPSTSIQNYWDGDIDWYSPAEIGNQIFLKGSQKKITELGIQKSSAKILPVGTVLFTSRAGIGNTAILARKGATNQGFQSIVPHIGELNSYFIFSRTSELKKYGEIQGAGSTFVEVSGKQMSKMPITLPTLPEQEAIGTFFRQLDELLTLHQRKLDDVKNLKQSLLQKMFPKNGEVVPEVRFPEFTDAWEQRKLGEVGFAKSGTGFPDEEQGGMEGIPFFKVSDMNTKGNENNLVVANNYVTDEQIRRKKWNVIDDVPAIFFAKVGAAVMLNRKRLVRLPFLLDNNTMAYIFDKSLWDCDFGKTIFETINLTKLTQVGALPSYNASDVEAIKIYLPQREEQEAIGTFFRQLDELLTLHQRKLEHLQSLKKSLLQQMFV
ncbi:restriction endonuclease subunit S [Streptococcus dentapri]|uniref:Restriction endonuclease subunit S n=1 Tax=Streptococcus dentapri TaxID=573564 RepID=A0ABV8D0W5_9STRE